MTRAGKPSHSGLVPQLFISEALRLQRAPGEPSFQTLSTF